MTDLGKLTAEFFGRQYSATGVKPIKVHGTSMAENFYDAEWVKRQIIANIDTLKYLGAVPESAHVEQMQWGRDRTVHTIHVIATVAYLSTGEAIKHKVRVP